MIHLVRSSLKRAGALLLLIAFSTNAQQPDSTKSKDLFELSFGQSLLFISSSKLVDLRNQEAIVVPTSSILFFAELRPRKIIRIPIFFNVPTETKQFLINGQLVNEKASPTLGTGLEFRLLSLKLGKKATIDLEAGPLASFLIDTKRSIRFAPVLAARLRIMKGENFIMYLGTSYSVGIDTWGILYGTGTTF
ncbi:MAG: hypothetical protein ACJ76F_11690 [Bacteroidia bacterium]